MLRMRITATLLALLLAACSDASGEADGLDARLARASQGLCDAQVLAFESNVPRAASVFDRETHGFLHELAADLEEVDRAAAAGLLEAKQRLEAILADPVRADPQEVVVLITELQRALRDGAEAAGLPTPLCEEGAS
ncbi:MAG: hypothetical protein ACRDIW_06745 [Actinomycetota bacterium]